MSELFAAGAVRLAGLVPRLLGWAPDQFWGATPAELMTIFSASSGGSERPLSRAELEHLLEREGDG